MFDARNGIEQRLTKVKHLGPRAGRAHEPHHQGCHRQLLHYDSHQQLETHLADFVSAYNFGRRLKTLKGLTPYEFICEIL